mgnify:CR=1 FL=1
MKSSTSSLSILFVRFVFISKKATAKKEQLSILFVRFAWRDFLTSNNHGVLSILFVRFLMDFDEEKGLEYFELSILFVRFRAKRGNSKRQILLSILFVRFPAVRMTL